MGVCKAPALGEKDKRVVFILFPSRYGTVSLGVTIARHVPKGSQKTDGPRHVSSPATFLWMPRGHPMREPSPPTPHCIHHDPKSLLSHPACSMLLFPQQAGLSQGPDWVALH